MARVEIPIVVLDSASPTSPVSGASAVVLKRTGGAEATVYANEEGGSTITQPLTSDSAGRLNGWLERGAYEVQITISGKVPFSEYLDVAPSADGGIDAKWLGTSAVETGSIKNEAVTREKMAAAAKPFSQTIGNGSAKEFTITHNLGTRAVWVVVRQAGSPYEPVWAGFKAPATTTNTVTIKFDTAPTTNQYTVTVFS